MDIGELLAQHERALEKAPCGLRLLPWLRERPAYAIPLVSIYGYFVAAQFLDAYLGWFSARSYWFDPSLFKLISFTRWPLISAAVTMFLFFLIIWEADSERSRWNVLFLTWCLWIAVQMGLLQLSESARDITLPWTAQAAWIGIIGFWLFVPLYARYTTVRFNRERCLLPDDLEILRKYLAGKGVDEDKRALARREEAVTRVEVSLKFLLRWRTRYAEIVLVISYCWLFLVFVAWTGWISAASDYAATSHQSNNGALSSTPATILFTDGNASLVRERKGEEVLTVFRSKSSDIVIELRTPYETYVRRSRDEMKRLQDEINRLEKEVQHLRDMKPASSSKP